MKKQVEEHYAEVARMVSNAETDPVTGFHVVEETRAACSLEDRSEAFQIYEERLVEGVPQRALLASRGCADPVSRADLQPGETVLDLGRGDNIAQLRKMFACVGWTVRDGFSPGWFD